MDIFEEYGDPIHTLAPLNETDLFKYFLNEDPSSPPFDYSRVVPDNSPTNSSSYYDSSSPPLTPDPMVCKGVDDLPIPLCIGTGQCLPRKSNNKESGKCKTKTEHSRKRATVSSSRSSSGDESKPGTPCDMSSPRSKEVSDMPAETADPDRQQKRQRRLIKNRESAQLSRMRKKVYIEDLEKKLGSITTDNSALKDEVIYLQGIIKQMSSGQSGSPPCPEMLANLADSSRIRAPVPSNAAYNSRAAGMTLLIVLFSFGLLFNALASSAPVFGDDRDDSGAGSRRPMIADFETKNINRNDLLEIKKEIRDEFEDEDLSHVWGFLSDSDDNKVAEGLPERGSKRTRDDADIGGERNSEKKNKTSGETESLEKLRNENTENATSTSERGGTPVFLMIPEPDSVEVVRDHSLSGISTAHVDCRIVQVHVWAPGSAHV